MAMTRKKSGFPLEEHALSALIQHSMSRICRALKSSYPTLAPYVSESHIARLSFDFQYLQEEHLGKNSCKPENTVKIPHFVFKDYSETGSLFLILEVILMRQKLFGDVSKTLINSIDASGFLQLHGKVKSVLLKEGFLSPKRFFIGDTVPHNELSRLERIIGSHDATITSSRDDASHILEWDNTVDGVLPANLSEEYIRTIDIKRNFDLDGMPVNVAEKNLTEADPFSDGTALVHWWYHPDSYDEYIPLNDVDNSEVPEGPLDGPGSEYWMNCVWHVCCRYVHDVELFNEWGNELDYELDIEKDTSSANTGAGADTSKSISGTRGRGRQARNKRKLNAVDDSSKKKMDSFSPVLEASLATEKGMNDTPPPSCASGRETTPAEGTKFSVFEVELSHSSAAQNDSTGEKSDPQATSCKLVSESPSIVWGGVGIDSNNKSAAECCVKRRRIGPGRHHFSSSPHPSVSSRPAKQISQFPQWFRSDTVSSVELKYLPEFFDGSSKLRTLDSYLSMRAFITNLYAQNTQTYLSATDCRRKLSGDVGAVLRIHAFLDAFSIINFAVPVDARPPIYPLGNIHPQSRAEPAPTSAGGIGAKSNEGNRGACIWSKETDKALLDAVSKYGSNWNAIGSVLNSQHVGSGVSAEDCIVRFAELPLTVASLSENSQFGPAEDAMECINESISAEQKNIVFANSPSREIVQSLLNEYIGARLSVVEEKVKLLQSVENILSVEQKRLELDRRDVQIQRAQLAFHLSQAP